MARYDVFANPSGSGYLLDVQADILDALNTRVVVPLIAFDKGIKIVRKLNPVFSVEGNRVTMFTHLLGAIPVVRLGEPRTNLLSHHDEIVAALDMLVQGF